MAVNRLEELQKDNPKLLDEIYFPTGNPSFEICDSDNENRTRIFDLVKNLPESKGWTGTAILDDPQINDKDYYWVRVTTKNNEYNAIIEKHLDARDKALNEFDTESNFGNNAEALNKWKEKLLSNEI